MPDRYRTTHRWLAAGLCALALGVTPRLSHADVSVAFSPSTVSVAPNSDFELFVDVSSAGSAFNAFRLVVGFDPAALTSVPLVPTSTQEGCLVTGACSAACGQTFRDFAATRDSVVAVEVLLCDLVSITGPGHLYRLRFHASGTAQAALLHVRRLVFYNAGETVEPVHITDAQVLIGVNAGVGDGGRAAAGSIRVEPNPAPGPVHFVSQDDRAGWLTAEIVDLQGRAVRRLGPLWLAPGQRFSWDGTDAAGTRVPAGVYQARIARSGGRASSSRFVLLQ